MTEDGERGTEVRSRKSEVSLRPIGAYAPVGGQKSEDRRQRAARHTDGGKKDRG